MSIQENQPELCCYAEDVQNVMTLSYGSINGVLRWDQGRRANSLLLIIINKLSFSWSWRDKRGYSPTGMSMTSCFFRRRCKILGNGLSLCVVITYITKKGYVGPFKGLAKCSLASYLIRYRMFRKRKGARISGLGSTPWKVHYFLKPKNPTQSMIL